MIHALVDDALRSKLNEFRVATELCDREGRVLGVYIPEIERERRLYERAKAQMSQADRDEIERRTQDSGGLTTEEVMQKLRDLEAQEAK